MNKKQLKLHIKKILEEEFALVEELGWDEEAIPGEYILDELVSAAIDAVKPIIMDKLLAAGWSPDSSSYSIDAEIEEPLMDALKPIAVMIYHKAETGRYE